MYLSIKNIKQRFLANGKFSLGHVTLVKINMTIVT